MLVYNILQVENKLHLNTCQKRVSSHVQRVISIANMKYSLNEQLAS